MQQRQRNPWKVLGLAIAVGIPTLLVAGAIVGMLEDDREMEKLASVVVADSAPPAFAVEVCNRFAAAQAADAKPGEAAAEAVTDVAANAPDSSERSAKERATGGLAGLSEENSRSSVTRAAFRECMVRKGYAS